MGKHVASVVVEIDTKDWQARVKEALEQVQRSCDRLQNLLPCRLDVTLTLQHKNPNEAESWKDLTLDKLGRNGIYYRLKNVEKEPAHINEITKQLLEESAQLLKPGTGEASEG